MASLGNGKSPGLPAMRGGGVTGIVVTGASRGIGRALALRLAAPGVTLALVGRDEACLRETAEACAAKGAGTAILVADIRDRDDLGQKLLAFDRDHPVGLAIANAGVALPTDDLSLAETAYGEIAINLVGALNTILPLIGPMTARGSGQLAFVSSIAAFAPLPDSPAYSASKAGLLVYGRALRERLHPRGIRVNVICPGYIETEMVARYGGWKPFLMPAGRAADRIVRGLERDRAVIAFPRRLALLARLSTLVPERITRLALKAFRFSIDQPRS